MARIYLAEEIYAVLAQAKSKIESATKLISSTEANVKSAIKAHQVPTEVNGIGVEGYQAAGILVAEAIAILTTLGASASDGLTFPHIAALGSPIEFTRVHVDDEPAASNHVYISGYCKENANLTPTTPFANILAGDLLKIIQCSPTIGNPVDLPDSMKDMILTVSSVGAMTDDSRTGVLFNAKLTYYDGESSVTHDAGDEGGESDSFEARVVAR